jgi:hypothetical protein
MAVKNPVLLMSTSMGNIVSLGKRRRSRQRIFSNTRARGTMTA